MTRKGYALEFELGMNKLRKLGVIIGDDNNIKLSRPFLNHIVGQIRTQAVPENEVTAIRYNMFGEPSSRLVSMYFLDSFCGDKLDIENDDTETMIDIILSCRQLMSETIDSADKARQAGFKGKF